MDTGPSIGYADGAAGRSEGHDGVVELAQVNVARLRDDVGSRVVAGFVDALYVVNQLADGSPGFVWRLPALEGHAFTAVGDGRDVVNLSIWASYEDLHAFVYRSPHGGFVRRRKEWFEPVEQPSTALWWVGPGERPTVEHALKRLAVLRREGPSPRVFSLRRRFTQHGLPHRAPSREGR